MRVLGIDFVVCSIGDSKVADAYDFYRNTLGITDDLIMGDGKADVWTEFDTKPVAFAFGQWKEPGRTVVALAVEDVRAAIEELRAKGVKVIVEPQEFPTCVMAGIEDPWGNQFMIHQRSDGTVG